MADEPVATRTAALKMSIAGRPIEAQIEVPEAPTRPRQLLPILQWFTDEVVEAARGRVEQEGKTISCRAGCGACCRQLVPISRAEAYQLAELVERLPETRRSEVRRRFQAAEERLAAAGLLEGLMEPTSLAVDTRALGLDYFRLGIACPFLENESCSIHSDRPLACREYLVTSPAENCRQPTAETIEMVDLPARVSKALLAVEQGNAKRPTWVPLSLAPRWAASHAEPPPGRSGPELLGDIFQRLSRGELPAAGEPAQTAARKTRPAVEPPNQRAAAAQAQGPAGAYDEVPYQGRPFAFTHPDTMATVATLYGMTPPPVERCRVLELGCTDGGNLVPMALGLPQARFVGLDLSPRQVETGRQIIEQLGLKNIDLRVMDLMDVDGSFGEFDFIICHGVFSWVPRPVQDKILAICSQHLAPQGVAYVSYNVYPGWRTRGMVREMALYHVDPAASAPERVRQARQFLEFLVENCTCPNSMYQTVLREELALWKKNGDAYLRHDQLGDVNEPCYFHEFAGRLANHRLQYITEAKLADNAATRVYEVRDKLLAYSDDVVRFEQHLDFLCDRTFRRSLLCHEQVRLDRSFPPELIERFLLGAQAIPIADKAGAEPSSTQQFRSDDGISFSSSDPWVKAALMGLFERSGGLLSFEEVCCEARRQLGDSAEARLDPRTDASILKLPLLLCAMRGLVELHVYRSPNIPEITERPRAIPLARLQAKTDHIVTSWRHARVELDEVERQVLLRLDGQHTRADLLEDLSALAGAGELTLSPGAGDGVASRSTNPPALLTEILRRFARFGLLDG
jgi:methyltransferase-like protein/Fe-S-cluster containining protein